MHLPDGLIPLNQVIIYWIIAIIGLSIFFLRFRLDRDLNKEKRIVLSGILTTTTIIASTITVPSPFGIPMHFFLIPLVVILLGPFTGTLIVFLSLLIQAFIGLGGLTVLGVNTVIMGIILPLATYAVYLLLSKFNEDIAIFSGTLLGIFTGAVVQIIVLIIAGSANLEMLALTLLPFYFFIGIIEGFITVLIMSFIGKINPELLKIDSI
jgi:cobalt/nickel transport system permease protein